MVVVSYMFDVLVFSDLELVVMDLNVLDFEKLVESLCFVLLDVFLFVLFGWIVIILYYLLFLFMFGFIICL